MQKFDHNSDWAIELGIIVDKMHKQVMETPCDESDVIFYGLPADVRSACIVMLSHLNNIDARVLKNYRFMAMQQLLGVLLSNARLPHVFPMEAIKMGVDLIKEATERHWERARAARQVKIDKMRARAKARNVSP